MKLEQDIERVTATTLHRLMVFVRLALVAALAAYTLPSVSFAMHGDIAASYAAKSTPENARHVHEAVHSDHDDAHIHGADDHQSASADHHQNNASMDCCSDFCLNLALVTGTPELGRVASSPVRIHSNDDRVTAEPIGFHRPPAART